MICDEISDLVPAYTLGTATAREIQQVEEHIGFCRNHDSDIDELMQTSVLLGAAAKPIEPSLALRERVLSHARTSGGGVQSPASGSPGAKHRHGILAAFRTGALRVNALAASLIVVVGALIVWNVMLQTSDRQQEKFTHYYWGMESDWLRLETVLGESGAEVSLGGIDRLNDTHLYHLWTTRGDDVLFVAAFNVSTEGRWAGDTEFTFEEGDRLWITAEPVGGTGGPTGDPVLRTRF